MPDDGTTPMTTSLKIGTRFGPYEVLAVLGIGGMGEVYRARDTTLGREVALKVLPERFALDRDRIERTTREAQALAALNHSNIASIYGLEEVDGTRALVLELVDGPTLADRIAAGALPVAEALKIAVQIAEALESAHAQGIVHRDLKPANVKLRADGVVKVLDFGLAKVFDNRTHSSDNGRPWPPTDSAQTRAGQIVGTVAYMSPEQARGKSVDKRTDIWAFGCVLYEMLCGTPAFLGEDPSATMARVIEREPDWRGLEHVPRAVARVVLRCLRKDPRDRLRDIGDARLEILEALSTPDEERHDTQHRPRRLALPVVAGAIAGAVAGLLGGQLWLPSLFSPPDPVPPPAERLASEINLAEDAPLALDADAAAIGFDATLVELSPDGRSLVYVGITDGTSRLFLRELDGFEARPLAGTEGALHAFFSPDGRSLGFLTNDQVRAYSLATGTTTTVCDTVVPVTATWMPNDDIFFAWDEGRRLARVNARGGAPVEVAEADEALRYGRVVPGGRYALVTRMAAGISVDYAEIALFDLETRGVMPLGLRGYSALYVSPGYLLFGRAGTIFAVAFDPEQNQVIGEPAPVASNVWMNALYPHIQFSVSAAGLLAYVPGGDSAPAVPAWVDRNGNVEFLPLEQRVYGMMDLSNDGRRLAVHVADARDYILIYDIARNEARRLSADESIGYPRWSPSGDQLAFTAFTAGSPYQLKVQRMDSDRPAVVVAESPTRPTPTTWSPDERQLTFYEFPGDRIGVVTFDAGGAPSPVRYLDFTAGQHDVSVDGRWLAYTANTGINLRGLPFDDRVQKISDFGTEPRWCPMCDELLFRSGNRWFASAVKFGSEIEWQPPREILRTTFNDTPGPSWVPSADGQRILVLKRAESRSRTRLHLIQGWQAAVSGK